MGADILAILAGVAMVMPAIWANDITISPTGLSDCSLAFSGGIEVEGDIYKRIKVGEVYHKILCFRYVYIFILLKHRILSLKVKKNSGL